MTSPDNRPSVEPKSQPSVLVAEIDAEPLGELMKAGSQLAEAAGQHWDRGPMEAAISRWDAALLALGKGSEVGAAA